MELDLPVHGKGFFFLLLLLLSDVLTFTSIWLIVVLNKCKRDQET